jgi:hypothetical protein
MLKNKLNKKGLGAWLKLWSTFLASPPPPKKSQKCKFYFEVIRN